MKSYSIYFLFFCSLITSFFLTKLLIKFSNKYEFYDQVNSRKIHDKNIPRIGGIAILVSFLGTLLCFNFFFQKLLIFPYINFRELLGYLISILLISSVGLYDDIKGANATQKFSVQGICAIILILSGLKIQILGIPFGGDINLGIFSIPVTILWVVGITNAINIIDGLDGLAAGISIIVLLSLIYLSFGRPEHIVVMIFSVSLLGAVFGFLPLNFHPAKIFMGDSGSLFIGLSLATLSIKSSQKQFFTMSLTVPIFLLAFPIIETLSTIIRRILLKKHIFAADNDHFHHRLLEKGFSVRKSFFILTGISGIFALIGIIFPGSSFFIKIILLVLSISFLSILIIYLNYFKIERLKLNTFFNKRSNLK